MHYEFSMPEDGTTVQWAGFYAMMHEKYPDLIMRKLFVISKLEITPELVEDCRKFNVTIIEYVPPEPQMDCVSL